jgi:hypothetical protein
MAETEITVVKFGESPVYTNAASGGHSYVNDGNTLLYVNNQTGSTATISHTEQTGCDFGHTSVNETDDAETGGVTRVWRTKNLVRWNDSAGRAHITITAPSVTSSGDANFQIAAVSYSKF